MTFQTFDDLGQQITRIDTAMVHEGLAACYLLGGGDEYAIIETGTHNTVPTILALLKERKIDLAKVRFTLMRDGWRSLKRVPWSSRLGQAG